MKRILLCLCVFASVSFLCANSPKEYDGALTELDVEGDWRLVGLENNGQSSPFDTSFHISFHRGHYVSTIEKGTYKLDSGHKLDRIPDNGPLKTRYNIFRIDCDTLRIASRGEPPNARPTTFDERDLHVLILKRERK